MGKEEGEGGWKDEKNDGSRKEGEENEEEKGEEDMGEGSGGRGWEEKKERMVRRNTFEEKIRMNKTR